MMDGTMCKKTRRLAVKGKAEAGGLGKGSVADMAGELAERFAGKEKDEGEVGGRQGWIENEGEIPGHRANPGFADGATARHQGGF